MIYPGPAATALTEPVSKQAWPPSRVLAATETTGSAFHVRGGRHQLVAEAIGAATVKLQIKAGTVWQDTDVSLTSTENGVQVDLSAQMEYRMVSTAAGPRVYVGDLLTYERR